MDRPGPFPRLLIAAAGVLLVAASAASRPPLKAAGWLAADADLKAILGTAPTECLGRITTDQARYEIEVGRAAFRSPLLFGGQAGKAGLMCDSCHRSGHGNPQFQFPGLSAGPGTADVTSLLMSPKRGKRVGTPKAIPDLSGPKGALRISQDPDKPDLESFIHGIVTEEFDGREPPPMVLKGLATYVRALSPGTCPRTAAAPVTASSRLEDARRALRAADMALVRKDPATAELMVQSARGQLGLIYERYPDAGLARSREAVRAADLQLLSLRGAVHDGSPAARQKIAEWIAASAGLERILKAQEKQSLFNPARL